MGIDDIAARLNEIAESLVEYETTHKDAGDSYAPLVAESWSSTQEDSLIAFMTEKGIDWTGLEIDLIADRVLDCFTMQSGHIWSAGNGDCLLEAFPVQEIEMQLGAQEIGVESVTKELCEALSRASDCYVTMQDPETILAYQTTDCVWGACVSEKALRDIVAAMRAEN